MNNKTISDKSISFYNKLYARRRGWTPTQPSGKQIVTEGAESLLRRALALSQLELPVGDYITEEVAKNPNLPDSLKTLLQANVEDEIKHDIALNNLRAVYAVPSELDANVAQFVNRATELANLYSPVVLAAALESSIFFVALPIYRLLGSQAFRTVANDISVDESIHVAVNTQLAKDLGYRRGKAVNILRSDIMDWLCTGLPFESENKYLSAKFWKQSSENLYTSGKTDNLAATKRSVMPAFFESAGNSLPIYG